MKSLWPLVVVVAAVAFLRMTQAKSDEPGKAPPALAAMLLELRPGRSLALVAAWIVVYAALARIAPGGQFWHDVLCGTRPFGESSASAHKATAAVVSSRRC